MAQSARIRWHAIHRLCIDGLLRHLRPAPFFRAALAFRRCVCVCVQPTVRRTYFTAYLLIMLLRSVRTLYGLGESAEAVRRWNVDVANEW